jgi:hypothetical protein
LSRQAATKGFHLLRLGLREFDCELGGTSSMKISLHDRIVPGAELECDEAEYCDLVEESITFGLRVSVLSGHFNEELSQLLLLTPISTTPVAAVVDAFI